MAPHNLSFDAPQIEILSTSPRLEMLQIRLRQSGLRPIRAEMPLDPATNAPLLLDMVTAEDDHTIRRFASDWKTATSSRLLVVLGTMPDALKSLGVLHLRDVDQIASLPARLAIRQRETRRRKEMNLREQTAKKLGVAPSTSLQNKTPRVLYLGDSSKRFMPLKFALNERQIEIVAALTRFTAQDYLSTGRFDGIILHPQNAEDEATKFLSRYTPSAGHGDTSLFLIEEPHLSHGLATGDANKVNALFDAAQSIEALADSLHDQLLRTTDPSFSEGRLSSQAHDTATKLFSRAFLEAHLDTQLAEISLTGASFTTLAICTDTDEIDQRRLAEIVAGHLRDSDLAAKLDSNHICITLPDTAYRGAVSLARRIETAAGTNLDWRAIERRQFHTTSTLLNALTARSVLGNRKRA